jgi:hypothetical protein
VRHLKLTDIENILTSRSVALRYPVERQEVALFAVQRRFLVKCDLT